jgi:hypothetical protein
LGQDQGADSESVFAVFNDYTRSITALSAVAKALANLIGEG